MTFLQYCVYTFIILNVEAPFFLKQEDSEVSQWVSAVLRRSPASATGGPSSSILGITVAAAFLLLPA